MLTLQAHAELRLLDGRGRSACLTEIVPLLALVKARGSISSAAAELGLSYRHAWGLLHMLEERLEGALVIKERGRGSVLSELGEKVLWADRLRAERLDTAMKMLAHEVSGEFNRVLASKQGQARILASHGYAVAELVSALHGRTIPFDMKYRESAEAVAALAAGECDLAGFHLPVGEFRHVCADLYRPLLDPGRHVLIHLTKRKQGLFLPKGNPKGIAGLSDLARADVRFVNRQPGSGTRMLLDLTLRKIGIDPDRIDGYASTELTHSAIAAFVASGMADLGFGVQPAAQHFGLDFIPIVDEDYYFVCERHGLQAAPLATILAILRAPVFRAQVERLDGYDPAECGKLVDVKDGLAGLGSAC